MNHINLCTHTHNLLMRFNASVAADEGCFLPRLLPLVEAIGHDNTHVGCVMCHCRTAQKTSCPFLLFYVRGSFHGELHMTFWSAHVFALRTWVWSIAASFLFPQQTMTMTLKHPDGLASSAHGQKCCDTDSIWLEKWGEVRGKEPHNAMLWRALQRWACVVEGPDRCRDR